MQINLFGFQKDKDKAKEKDLKSFVSGSKNDGAVEVESGPAAMAGSLIYDQNFDAVFKNDKELIEYYRAASMEGDLNTAIDDIVNEAISFDADKKPVALNLSQVDGLSKAIQNKMIDEFNIILKLLNFSREGDEIFRRWYIDGKGYYHILVDDKATNKGIQELRFVDPRFIKKIRKIEKVVDPVSGIEVVNDLGEMYVYSNVLDNKKSSGTIQSIEISPEAIAYYHSGLYDDKKNVVVSHLHPALKLNNQLKSIEDSKVIYTMTRATEKRIFYVDVGNLPKTKAEEYMRDIMSKYKNKIVYDVNTGAVGDKVAHRSMMEDIWLPRREGSHGTEVDTLEAGQNLGEMEEANYFRKKMYKVLHIPGTRLDQDTSYQLGRSGETTRDEIKFAKFADKLRKKFSTLFYILLKTQLVLKNIITEEDWNKHSQNILFDYSQDSYYAELKEVEILNDRIELLSSLDEFVGKYFSETYVKKNILRQSDEEIRKIEKEIKAEGSDEDFEDRKDAELGGGEEPAPEPEPEEEEPEEEPTDDEPEEEEDDASK